jgi:hypothetical protein
MFRVLQVILSGNRIASGMCVARKLEIFLRDMLRISANLDVRTV